jgi:drug/metabolite transporter (DMT)-like permease
LLGVVIFAATLPLTKLAVGSSDAPQLSAAFVSFGRAAVAGVLSLFYLAFMRHADGSALANYPQGRQWALLAVTASGVVLGFPLLLALALRHVPSTHGAVVTGLLPLATAVLGALWFRQKPSLGFWACAVLGSALVLAFMVVRAGSFELHQADLFLIGAMLIGGVGYVGGAALTPSLGAERVICWVLVISLPFTLPLALLNAPGQSVPWGSWLAFAYLALFSMWIGFFAWYRALAIGGAVRVSQVQLLQPFISILMAVPLLGERLDAVTVLFALAVIATVFAGKRMSVQVASR